MDWSRDFYSTTGRWWGPAESGVTERDHERVAQVRAACGIEPAAEPTTMLELGCGYGSTAAVAARKGFQVLGIDISDRLTECHEWLAVLRAADAGSASG
ncbi:methyltransferase domain-containing protein [Catenulispora rubra]|uniref:methyltransferase domain-containing protein n=1 Tax=Catenulispora rubra TaxID=280293 RepID=UPI001892001E|nr:methyltransferase domain-containing protein [Catenulispora rubra]